MSATLFSSSFSSLPRWGWPAAGCWIHAPVVPAPSVAATPEAGAASTSASASTSTSFSPGATVKRVIGSHDGFLGLTNASLDGNATNRFMGVELDAVKQRVCVAASLSSPSQTPLSDPRTDDPPSMNATESLKNQHCVPHLELGELIRPCRVPGAGLRRQQHPIHYCRHHCGSSTSAASSAGDVLRREAS
uniref:Uncharacterized protein n=1 Tax=Oryza rufipogon TaxID=4529 RepID=A0A0E0R008_ORYRU